MAIKATLSHLDLPGRRQQVVATEDDDNRIHPMRRAISIV